MLYKYTVELRYRPDAMNENFTKVDPNWHGTFCLYFQLGYIKRPSLQMACFEYMLII